jgi:hypothetical protein
MARRKSGAQKRALMESGLKEIRDAIETVRRKVEGYVSRTAEKKTSGGVRRKAAARRSAAVKRKSPRRAGKRASANKRSSRAAARSS